MKSFKKTEAKENFPTSPGYKEINISITINMVSSPFLLCSFQFFLSKQMQT
jgi:hypothetical protein